MALGVSQDTGTSKLARSTRRGPGIVLLLTIVLLALLLLSFNLGRYPVSAATALQYAWESVTGGWTGEPEVSHVITRIRLPRFLLAVLIGLCLSLAGAVYQQVFRNPLVSPDILGASSGAGFGAALALSLGAGLATLQTLALVFGLLAVAAAWSISRAMRRDAILGLVLAGIVISAVFSAGTSFLKYTADPDEALPAITFWLMGGLSGVRVSDILTVAVPAAVCCAILWANRHRLNVLGFGDDAARAMGVNVTQLRVLVIIIATLLTTASVAVGGLIAWIGLVVPHISRMLVGPDMRRLIPITALLGGIFLLVVDDIARTWLTMEIPLGILTALIGAPFLVALIAANREW